MCAQEHRLSSHATPDASKWLSSAGSKPFWAPANDTAAGSTSGGVPLVVEWTQPDAEAHVPRRLSHCIVRAGQLGAVILYSVY